jgi:predicted RNA binding protein YcfA (HicA-like mRNA interferase family)
MPLDKREIEKKLTSKFGFVQSNSDHRKFSFYQNERRIAMTVLSHSHKVISDKLLGQMAKQVGVRRQSFFKEMINCTKSLDDNINEISTNGWLERYN